MSVNILFAAADQKWSEYKYHLSLAINATGVDANISTKIAPESVDYIVYAPNSELIDFSPYTRAKAILNLWAGVETVVGNQTLQIPLCRMVDPALT
ncbi:MAG: glyoxylate/hydroxypyruvate reductase A, partial [Tateyamaria sp.]|nr:glyoxylate/hydroxypyruvate reductase A [Tateyamaria sp.]